jgi:hypothetical protein
MRSPVRQTLVRLALVTTAIATGPLLSACSSASLDSLDPSEWLDTKKKVAGERKDVFPGGVPGVTAGVPAELVKGYREPEGGPLDPAKAAAEAAAGTANPAPQRVAQKPKPKPKTDQARTADPSRTADPRATVTPASSQQQPPASTTAWPAPQQQASPWPGNR